MTSDTHPLESFLTKLYERYKENRKLIEPEWERAYNAYKQTDISPDETRDKKGDDEWRSRSVPEMTRVKVNAAKILVCDVLLAGGELPFMLKEDNVTGDIINAAMERVETESEEKEESAPLSPGVNMMMALIKEQLAQANADKTMKKTIFSSALYGDGIARVFTDDFRHSKFETSEDGWQKKEIEKKALNMRHVSVWNFFTDMEERDIQKNHGLFERTKMSKSEIQMKFADDGNVFRDVLRESLKSVSGDDEASAANDESESPVMKSISKRSKNIDVLEYWGRAGARSVESFEKTREAGAGPLSASDLPDDNDEAPDAEIMAVIVNGRIVKYSRVPAKSRPYFRASWEEPLEGGTSEGIASAMKQAQCGLDEAMRMFEDNKRLAGNVMFAVKSKYLDDKSGNIDMKPGGIIKLEENCTNIQQAIQQFTVADIGTNLHDMINMYQEAGSNTSMIPDIAHGVAPANPATAYEVSIRNEKAGKYIADVVRGFDDEFIEPLVKFFYEWNMDDAEIPNEFKGVFSVQALGFTSYQDRVLRMNRIREMLQLVLSNPALSEMVNIQALLREWTKANDLDEKQFMKDDTGGGIQAESGIRQFMQNFIQMIDERFSAIEKALPSLSMKSELEAAKGQAEIAKIEADTALKQAQAQGIGESGVINRAKTVADIETKNRADKIIEFN